MTPTSVEGIHALLGAFTEAYREHLFKYEQWLAVAEAAGRKLDADELDDFLALHEKKQALADGLREEEGELRRSRRRLQESLRLDRLTVGALEQAAAERDEKFQAAVDEWRRVLARLSETMQRVAEVEKRNEDKLRRHVRSLSESVSDARKTRRAVRAYYTEGDDRDARFIDRKR